MDVRIRGAQQNNLKNIDIDFGDGLTVVTGVSGSGKTSLVFDTLYHEAQRRFLDIYLYGRGGQRLSPAKVVEITGLGPTIAVGQNLLNRNPNSILATAAGLHPFFRLLFVNYGERFCLRCDHPVQVLTVDEIIARLEQFSPIEPLQVRAPLMSNVRGSHQTLLTVLAAEFGDKNLIVNGGPWTSNPLPKDQAHTLEILMGHLKPQTGISEIRQFVEQALALGAGAVHLCGPTVDQTLTTNLVCTACGTGLGQLRAPHFNQKCPYCEGERCPRCAQTGLHPRAAAVRWQGLRLPELLTLTIDDAHSQFAGVELPPTANRLKSEILRRLAALQRVGLGYLVLDRPAPTLSRGESQRVRLAISLTSQLEDMRYVLDEPTIGQHPADVARFLPAFRDLAGPVIFVEHERLAAAAADQAVDIGPGAGGEGGEIVFQGAPGDLWSSDSATGRFFSLDQRVPIPAPRPATPDYLQIKNAHRHNLQQVSVQFPLGRLTVVTGVSGSGKSTLVEHVLVPSLKEQEPIGCEAVLGSEIKPTMVDQTPIGRNPRSNPATYTKLSDQIRELFAAATGLTKSHFSFNRPEGACQVCKGIGAEEVKMRFLPSIWIPCEACEGTRFSPEVLAARVDFDDQTLSVADIFATPIRDVGPLIANSPWLPKSRQTAARKILRALVEVGLGYLKLGQPSPTLSGGEAQRVKLAKYLSRANLRNQLLVLDEPSTGLHPQDLAGLLTILDRLVRQGATIVVVEHNTDVIRAADWIIDLGPGAGPQGGEIIYQGPPTGIFAVAASLTGQALQAEDQLQPRQPTEISGAQAPQTIQIRNARANNLKGVDVHFPKGKFTVVTGVSGSGKSSLVMDVLQTEARRRYLESLSMYERQGINEGAEAPVDAVTGLGVTLTVAPHHAHLWSHLPQFTRRNSVGALTEISFHLTVLLAELGQRECAACGVEMLRRDTWICPNCVVQTPIAPARNFSATHWSSSCGNCNGLGTLQRPEPNKLIVNPGKPLCAGAMYSPGYWPHSYLCVDQPIIGEIGKYYDFDPLNTPWNEMSKAAQNAFLYGDGRQYTWTYFSKGGRSKGQEKQSTWTWTGFYGEDSWVFSGDVHGTYTRQAACPKCDGSGLRPEYLLVRFLGENIFELNELPVVDLERLLAEYCLPADRSPHVETSLNVIRRRLRFLRQVGVGYLHLNRPTGTLSAGEAQRIQLASLLGSDLTSLTILADEPSRGMHPTELVALRTALQELCTEGNTVIVVEHDALLMRAADHIVDVGPGSGVAGGQIVAQGSTAEIIAAGTITGKWLKPQTLSLANPRRVPQGWLTITGARANNLRGETATFPLGILTGVCGVSGSGKSTLVMDTLGRALVKPVHTSSFANAPLDPGTYKAIENAPNRALLVDQTRRGIHSPAKYLGLEKPLLKLYADSDDAHSLGLSAKDLSERCSACRGHGRIRIEMGFLPDEWLPCEICQGTGYRPEAWEVRLQGVALPEINVLTVDQVLDLFQAETRLADRLRVLQQVGLGYLVWNQAAYTLSGGEVQRLKIAKELMKKTKSQTLYILDEPTVGLHMEDVARLVEVLQQLVDAGHTVLGVEHNPQFLVACDWIVELGPVGGPGGGQIIATGPPEDVMTMETPTAPYLRELLKENHQHPE
jgi:excinuclease ABC subunit A